MARNSQVANRLYNFLHGHQWGLRIGNLTQEKSIIVSQDFN
jgi:hypothetical protein